MTVGHQCLQYTAECQYQSVSDATDIISTTYLSSLRQPHAEECQYGQRNSVFHAFTRKRCAGINYQNHLLINCAWNRHALAAVHTQLEFVCLLKHFPMTLASTSCEAKHELSHPAATDAGPNAGCANWVDQDAGPNYQDSPAFSGMLLSAWQEACPCSSTALRWVLADWRHLTSVLVMNKILNLIPRLAPFG